MTRDKIISALTAEFWGREIPLEAGELDWRPAEA
jgi:hypothetical protein